MSQTQLTKIPGLLLKKSKVYVDERGTFRQEALRNDLPNGFFQANRSVSKKGVIRGLHFQTGTFAQGKLVSCLRGRIFDVAVDLRKGSTSYGEWYGIELSPENGLQLAIPEGFAHGFQSLEDNSEVLYFCFGAGYHYEAESGVRFDDPDIGVEWPLQDPILSEKDINLKYLRENA
jgi:dTDP-4-dehydrorhamnose 3,5-epimerase